MNATPKQTKSPGRETPIHSEVFIDLAGFLASLPVQYVRAEWFEQFTKKVRKPRPLARYVVKLL